MALLANSPPSSTRRKLISKPRERKHDSNHCKISTGGVLDFVGNAKGYDVDPQVTSKPVVTPQMDLTLKNEELMCSH